MGSDPMGSHIHTSPLGCARDTARYAAGSLGLSPGWQQTAALPFAMMQIRDLRGGGSENGS